MNASRQVMLETARGPVAVTPGVIDDEAEYAYRNGQCIALSLALAKETGWPIVVQLSKPGDPWWEEKTHGTHIPPEQATAGWMYHFVHSLVQAPMGRFSTSVASTTGRISGPMLPTAMAPPRWSFSSPLP